MPTDAPFDTSMNPVSITGPIGPTIFTVNSTFFIEDDSAYHTVDINLASITSINSWCTQ